VTWVRFGSKGIYNIQFQSLCHTPIKIYYDSWKFDEVMTETKRHSFFETQCSFMNFKHIHKILTGPHPAGVLYTGGI